MSLESLPVANVPAEELDEKKQKISDILNFLGINFAKIDVKPGPVISFWEIYPDKGVKVSKVREVKNVIESSIGITGTRVICPVPGRGTIGIEIPNKSLQTVNFSAMISTEEFAESKMQLPLALGITNEGKPFIVDLVKMPHILIGGSFGVGKSVMLHAMIASLLCKKSPEELKFVLIDTRLLEFMAYKTIKEFIAVPGYMENTIITDVSDAIKTLEGLKEEMILRYDILRVTGARNISDYNNMVAGGKIDSSKYKHLPYIVTMIDNFADLIMCAGSRFEMPLCSIAQLSRAVGIHLIISTPRISPDIITGLIKANFPCRIAFQARLVSDSLLVLDSFGPEKLMGRGDCLFSCGKDPIRIQGSFIDEYKEIADICKQIKSQDIQQGLYHLPVSNEQAECVEKIKIGEFAFKFADSLFEEAAKIVVETQVASTSMLQRKLYIGYTRAGRIMEILAAAGIIAPLTASFQTKVLIPDLETLANHIANIKNEMLDDYLKSISLTCSKSNGL